MTLTFSIEGESHIKGDNLTLNEVNQKLAMIWAEECRLNQKHKDSCGYCKMFVTAKQKDFEYGARIDVSANTLYPPSFEDHIKEGFRFYWRKIRHGYDFNDHLKKLYTDQAKAQIAMLRILKQHK